MGGEKRRENLLKILQESESAVSGTKLATKFQVPPGYRSGYSITFAKNHDIISTHKGYVLDKGNIQFLR